MAELVAVDATQITLLFVDDEPHMLKALVRLFKPHHYRVLTAPSGEEGLDILAQEPVTVVISDMRMPQMDGADFLAQVAVNWPQTVRLLLTGYADLSATVAAVNKGHIYAHLSKPWDDNDLLLTVRRAAEQQALKALVQRQNQALQLFNEQLEEKVKQRTQELRQTMGFLETAHTSLKSQFATSVKVFANLIEVREGATKKPGAGHSRRVAEQAHGLALQMGMGEAEAQDVLFAGLLHDIGKLALPDTLLGQAYQEMAVSERLQFEKHPVIGQAALIALEDLQGAGILIRSHHERFDGEGYPDKLQGEQIPLGASILAVVTDYDALQTGSFSQRRHTPQEARGFLLRERGRRYDPAVVKAFVALLDKEKQQSSTEDKYTLCLKSGGLKSGMVLAQDLVTQGGVLLLSKGHVLNDPLISKIYTLEETMACEFEFYLRRGVLTS